MDPTLVEDLKKHGLEDYLNNAYGWAYFENVGKFGFLVGMGGGGGKVYVREGETSKQVGTSTMMEASGGWSLGVQVKSQIIFFENEAAFKKFTSGTFAFDATAQCAVATLGAETSAASGMGSELYGNGMATFIVVKGGLMVDVSVGGQSFNYTAL